jgi:hypothetical protein
MDIDQKIRTRFPVLLAEVYQTAELTTNKQIQAQRWVDFFEEIVRYLSLVGLSFYRQLQLSDEQVESARKELVRPSLGHWVQLFKALETTLNKAKIFGLTSPLNQKHHDNAIKTGVNQMKALLGNEPLKTVRLQHLLNVMVEFRNKKIGHGSMSTKAAEQAIQAIKPAMLYWLDRIPILEKWHLIYIHRVEWQDPHYLLLGTKNLGTSLYNARFTRQEKVSGQQVYLTREQDDQPSELIPLYPFITFDNNDKLFYVFTEISSGGQAILRCRYKAAQAHKEIKIDAASLVLGTEKEPQPEDAHVPSSQEEEPTEAQPATKDHPMKPWYDLITPHEDIRTGQLDEAVFHADLGDVANRNAPDDYNDAYLFFKKTFLTQGLENLFHRVHTTLTQGQGSSVVQIQTPFGGGKTHALVAIYHYLKHSDKIKELLPAGVPPLSASVVAIAGNHWNPVEGFRSDGITRRTFWGELAFQLGRAEGYEIFRQNDESRISPGKDKLRRFLEDHQPFVLLFDEILEYINRALDEKEYHAREKTGVSLGTQTFSFFQELTEAVATIPKGMLVVTLPSSYLEDFSDETEESLTRLSKIFGRIESIETPVHDEEVYEVIRRRLFEVETLNKGAMRSVVHRYFQTYKNNRDDLPAQVRDVAYRDKMELAYPFHPSVIDILYEKWSTFTTFQRTRGVLRLLANVVEDLYQRESPVDMILPGDINLNHPSIRREFLKHIGPEYEGIIGSDIAGHRAKAPALDKSNRQWDHLAERVSTAIFYHSFSADDSEKGVSRPYIKLASIRSDTIPALVTEVLQRLSHILWYLNQRGDIYFFSHIPNLNRMIMDKKELFNESYKPKLREVIEDELGKEFRTYLWPSDGDGIPDNRALKLVILHPEDSGDRISDWLERKGETFREYKNTLFFALADTAAFASLRDDVKKVLALGEIEAEIKSGDSSLPEEKLPELQRQSHAIQRDHSYKVRRMYHVLHLGDREIDLGEPTTGAETLSHWYWHELTSDDVGAILKQLHYRVLVRKFLGDNDQIATSALLDQFYKNPDLPVPASPGVVARAIQLGIKDGAFGLVEMMDGEINPETLKYKTDLPMDVISFDPGTYLLTKERSETLWQEIQPSLEGVTEPETPSGPGAPGERTPSPPTQEEEPTQAPQPKEKSYQRIRLVVSGIPASKIADVNRGILLPLSRSVGDFKFTIEIDVTSEDGLAESVLENQIKETIRQIGGQVEREELT